MEDIKTLLKQYEDINAEFNKAIKENGDKFIAEIFENIFAEHVGLNVVVVRGWTPVFNDGEACTHSTDIYIGDTWGQGKYLDFDDCDDLVEVFELDSETNNHLNSDCNTLQQSLTQVSAYEEVFERVYGTNFDIIAKRQEDGSVEVTYDEYDCGF